MRAPRCPVSRLSPLPVLLLAGCPADAPVPEPEGCVGPALWEPLDGATATFRHPPVAWSAVSGATSYSVQVTDASGSILRQAEVAGTEWRPELDAGGEFVVSVTALPGGETCASAYRVRTLGTAPTVESPTAVCGRDPEAAIETSWAVAWSGGSVFATLNAEGAGICAHDAETLAFTDTFAARGGAFRSYGLTADADGTLYATTFPLEVACGDTMFRVARVADPSGARELTWLETGQEAGVSVAVAQGLLFETGLAGAACYGVDSACLDLGEPCPDGAADLTAWDLDAGANRFHREGSGSPGLAADTYRVYRSGPDASLLVHDLDGALLFELPTTASPRGVVRHDADDGRFLLVTDFDQQLHVYELLTEAPSAPEDLVEVTTRALPDRYWQGAVDDQGRFYWSGQLGGRLARWDLE